MNDKTIRTKPMYKIGDVSTAAVLKAVLYGRKSNPVAMFFVRNHLISSCSDPDMLENMNAPKQSAIPARNNDFDFIFVRGLDA